MLEYVYKIQVKLDGKMIGEIRQVSGGYQYFPKGQKIGGAVYGSIEAVKRSLHG